MASEYPELVLGRVVLQERDLYQVVTEQEDYSARVSGKFRYGAERPSDYPAVGDFVLLQCVNKNDIAVIQKVLPRKSVFLRKAAGTNDQLETGDLRNDDKGKHTTTHRELFMISGKGMVIDTPGMRELGMWSAQDGIDHTFPDIEELVGKCRFSDCSHGNESGCAVRQAVKDGLITEERYRVYMRLKAENAYNENAVDYLVAKKRKFKQIAKLNKHNYKQ